MTTIGIRALRSDLARFVSRAERGEHITISTGGKPVAHLAPLTAEADNPGKTLDALIASGQILAPTRHDAPPDREPLAVWAGMRMDRVLREVRGR